MTQFGPLLFRIAAWPIESVLEIASPGLAERVDAWLATEERLRRDAGTLCDALFARLPAVPHRDSRAAMLAVRRALHRSLDPLPADTLAHVVHRCGLPSQVRGRLAKHDATRRTWSGERTRLKEAYREATAREVAILTRTAAHPSFRKALAVASLSASTAWETVLARGAEHPLSPRLIETLYRYLTRAAGRSTPNGLWAGVAMDAGECAGDGHLFEVSPRRPSLLAQPDLAIVDRVIKGHA